MPYYRAVGAFKAEHYIVIALNSMFFSFERQGDDEPPVPMSPIIVYMAFAFEAYTNSLGYRFVSGWVERAGWRAKIETLHRSQGKVADWSSGPLAFVLQVFDLRDRFAHGKPEECSTPWERLDNHPGHVRMHMDNGPKWWVDIDRSWMLDAKVKHRQAILYLAGLFGLGDGDFGATYVGRIEERPDHDPPS